MICQDKSVGAKKETESAVADCSSVSLLWRADLHYTAGSALFGEAASLHPQHTLLYDNGIAMSMKVARFESFFFMWRW